MRQRCASARVNESPGQRREDDRAARSARLLPTFVGTCGYPPMGAHLQGNLHVQWLLHHAAVTVDRSRALLTVRARASLPEGNDLRHPARSDEYGPTIMLCW